MHLLRVLGAFAVVAAICWTAIANGDRETLTSPPDAVAEGFFREVVTRRFDMARPYVASEPGSDELRALLARIEARTGNVDDVSAELVRRTNDKALVNVRLQSASGAKTVPVGLVFTGGGWRLERVP